MSTRITDGRQLAEGHCVAVRPNGNPVPVVIRIGCDNIACLPHGMYLVREPEPPAILDNESTQNLQDCAEETA